MTFISDFFNIDSGTSRPPIVVDIKQVFDDVNNYVIVNDSHIAVSAPSVLQPKMG